jgi:hypothetical protein
MLITVDLNPKVSVLTNKMKLLNKKPEEKRLKSKKKLDEEEPMQVDDLHEVKTKNLSCFLGLLEA